MDANRGGDLLHGEAVRAREEGVGCADNYPFFAVPAAARGEAAALLVHGFSATPWEMRPLAEALSRRGFPCLAIRLPGHGTTPEDLAGRCWEEWLEAVGRGYLLLAARFPRIYGIGLSTGTLLLLALSQRHDLQGLALLSPYLRLQHRLAPFAGWLRYLRPYQRQPLSAEESRHYYDRRPLAGVHQINLLLRELAPKLGSITLPVLAMHGEGDQTVDIDSGRHLVERLGSTIKIYERFGPEVPHVLTGATNPQREAVFDLIGKFLEDLEGQRCPRERRN